MRTSVSILRLIGASLLSGSLAVAIMLVHAPRAEDAAPRASPGMLPATEIPYYAEWAGSPHAKRGAEPFNHWNKEGNIPPQCAVSLDARFP